MNKIKDMDLVTIISKIMWRIVLRFKVDRLLSDELYLKFKYRVFFYKKLNLNKPRTFNEKLQWLKLYDRKKEYIDLVDKHKVKQIVKEKIGEEYIIPTLGVWDSAEKIKFSDLPSEFVLKCTHDSGGVILCTNKDNFNINSAKRVLQKNLKTNFYYNSREWPYKGVKPQIIAEKYMGDNLKDYKLQCFEGKVDHVLVCVGRYSQFGVRYYYFDTDWNDLHYSKDNGYMDVVEKPKCLKEMIFVAEKLSEGMKNVRVDLYEVEGKVYFGELTLYTQAGFDIDITEEADIRLGEKLLCLPEEII